MRGIADHDSELFNKKKRKHDRSDRTKFNILFDSIFPLYTLLGFYGTPSRFPPAPSTRTQLSYLTSSASIAELGTMCRIYWEHGATTETTENPCRYRRSYFTDPPVFLHFSKVRKHQSCRRKRRPLGAR